jgi:hypothetical protein
VPQLGAAAVVLGAGSGIACYLWLARLMPRSAALAGAIFYLASPFHVFVDLYVRADYAEFAAMTFTPLVMLGVELVRERRAGGIVLIGLGYAAVVLAHVVVGLLFSAVPLVYVILRSGWRPGWPRQAVVVLAASLLGLAISAFYLVPALAYRPDVVMPVAPMAVASFIFGGPARPMLIRFVWLMFAGYSVLLISLTAWWRWRAPKGPDNLVLTCGGLAVVTLAFMTVWARPIWLMLPILWTLQFSYRLFAVIDLCMAALIGSFVAAAAGGIGRWVGGAILGIAAAASAAALWFGLFHYDAALWRERMHYTDDYGLFRPQSVVSDLPADRLPLYSGGVFGPDIALLPRTQVLTGDADIDILLWRPRHIILVVDARSAGRMAIGQLYVPAWRATEVQTGAPLPVEPLAGTGLLAIPFAAGTQQIEVSLIARPPEYAGLVLSALGLAGLGGFAFAMWRGPARRQAIRYPPAPS